MLDEKLEYRSYLSSDTDVAPLRVDSVETGNGLRRPLRILARGFLDNCEELGLELEPRIRYCKQFLETWLTGEIPEGFAMPETHQALWADVQLAKTYSLLFHAKNLLRDMKIKNSKNTQAEVEQAVDESIKKLQEKVEDYRLPPYLQNDSFSYHDFNQIRLEQVISDALIRKPLRNQCFVFRKSIQCGLAQDGQEHLLRVALGIICFYLQTKDETPTSQPQAYVPVAQQEIANWLDTYAKSKGCDAKGKWKECVSKAMSVPKLTDGEPLFDRIVLESGVKVRVNPLWLDLHNARLITEEQIAEYQEKGYEILDDSVLRIASKDKKAKSKFTQKFFVQAV